MATLPTTNEPSGKPTATNDAPSDNNPQNEDMKTNSKKEKVTSDFKHKFLAVSNPLVVVLGIGEYDNDAFPNLIGVTRDYQNVQIALNYARGYSMAFLTKEGKLCHFKTKCEKHDINDAEKYKVYWSKTDIFDFNTQIVELLNKNISPNSDNNNDSNSSAAYDGLIYLISCHGDDKTIFLSNGKQLKIQKIFQVFDNENCGLLRGYPKIYVIDKCRGDERTSIEINSLVDTRQNVTVSQYSKEKREEKKLLKPSLLTMKLTLNYENGIGAKSQRRRNKAVNKCHKIKGICNHYYNFARNNGFVSRFSSTDENRLVHTRIKRTISKNGDSYKIYANTPGYKAMDGGDRGGYLIRSFTKVIHSDVLFKGPKIRFRDIIQKTRVGVDSLIGDVGAQVLQEVKTTVYQIKLFENVSQYNNNTKFDELKDEAPQSTVMLSTYDEQQVSTLQSIMEVTSEINSDLSTYVASQLRPSNNDSKEDDDDMVHRVEPSNGGDVDNDIDNNSGLPLTICYQNYTKYVVFAKEISMAALYTQGKVELKNTVISPNTPIVFENCKHTQFEIGKPCKSITLSKCEGIDLSIAEPCRIGSTVTVKNSEFCSIYIGVIGTKEIILKDCKHITLHFASHVLVGGHAPVINSENNENMVIYHQDLEGNNIDENISTLRLDDLKKYPNMDLNNIDVYELAWSEATYED